MSDGCSDRLFGRVLHQGHEPRRQHAADDLRHTADIGQCGRGLHVHPESDRRERQGIDVQHQERTGLDRIQHSHRPALRHTGRRLRRHLREHRDLRQRRYVQRVPGRLLYRGDQISNGTATVNWTPPTDNTNGTALTGLAGYQIHYGTASNNLSQTVQVANSGLTSYTLTNLTAGTWYFAVTSYTTSGTQSSMSNLASKTIQ